jgi:hypothetical protein
MAAIKGLEFEPKKTVKSNESFFFNAASMIEPTLYMKGHWLVHYKDGIFMWKRNPSCRSPHVFVFKDHMGK